MRLKFNYTLSKLIALFVISLAGTGSVLGQNPVANFTGTPLAGCSPLIVNFQDQSTGSPTIWAWDFGNGNTSTLQNPTATYFTPGTYTITLTSTNANGSGTLTRNQYITVYEPPTVNFSASVINGCFPLRVQFNDLSSAGVGNTNTSWAWDFGNGVTSTLQNPFITYTNAGTFTVTLKVTNDKGCTRTLSRPSFITVTPGVTAGFTHTQPTVCSAPANITFTNSSTGPGVLSYQWNFGDGNFSAALNPVHTYTVNGTYTVTLVTSSSSGCDDTVRTTVPITIGGFATSFSSPASVCINEPATFINTSSPVPVSTNWTFGDGGSAAGINASHSYAVPGVYTVRLYNTYSICTDSALRTITVNPRPVTNFTAPVTSKCEPPLTVDFQDISTGGAVSWQWNFGDGGTSTLQNPSHTYTAYGSFDVTLIAVNAFGCTDTIVKPNFIRIRRAMITIPNLPVRGCIPLTVSPVPVITLLDAVTSYQWDFGDGGTSTLANPTHTYVAQGTYNVRLIITTSSGCTDTLLLNGAVRAGSKPIANFSATPIPVCANQEVQFTDLSVPADEWLWDFGDGITSAVQNPLHAYTDTGFFTVRLIATNNGCPDTIVRNNYIYVLPPIARFNVVANCSNRSQFSFVDQSIAPLTWAWDFGDGGTAIIQNPVHSFPALGAYTVRLIVTNGGCADTITRVVNAIDEAPDFTGAPRVACKFATVNFLVQNVNLANVVSFFWDFGDGAQFTQIPPAISHTYVTSGTYTVTLISTDLNGCKDTISKVAYIRVNGPSANFLATNVTGCAGLTTTFNDLSTNDGINAIQSWRWDFGDGAIQTFAGPPFQHTYNTAGTYSVKLIVTDAAGCRDSLIRLNIIVTTDPVPGFISADTVTCPGSAVAFTNTSVPPGFTSLWYFGDGGTSTIASPSHTYVTVGTYNVKLVIRDAIGCLDSITKNLYIRVDGPIPNFTASDTAGSCTPLEIQFTNTSSFYSSVFWDFGPGQGTSALNNPVHYYNLPGLYPVKLVVTSPGGCKDSIIKNITVYDTSGAAITYPPLDGCKPFATSFSAVIPGPMASYLWDFGDGITQITTTPAVNHTYLSYGNFLPKLIMEDPAGCLIPLQGLDTILVTGANAAFAEDTTFFCDRGTVRFSDSTTFNDPIASYNWTFGDGASSILQNPVHQYTAPGIYTVRLIVQTQLGCRDTLIKPAVVKVVRSPITDIGGDSVVCVNSSLQHAGFFIIPDTSAVSWSWNFPNGNTSILQIPLPQTYKTAGNFTVRAVATNSSGCTDTTTRNIIVNPLPTVNMPGQITVQNGFPVTIPATYTPNTLSWLWSPAQGLSCTTCPTPDAGPKSNTTYQVYFTDENDCSNTASIQVIVICKNANLFIPNTFSPNGDGSNEIFYPRGKGLERVRLLRIFNRWGEIVFEKKDFPVNDAASGWNGTFKGKKVQADVYIYQAEVFCDNGDIIRLNGNIALIL